MKPILCLLVMSLCIGSLAAAESEKVWSDLIREAPYRISKGMSDNFHVIRRWVLFGEGYCEQSDRHILFDVSGRFLGWMANAETDAETQAQLNERRQQYQADGKVLQWLPGSETTLGYPFAFSCNQPHVNVQQAIDRLNGTQPSDLIWGTWDGMKAGTESDPISLADTAKLVWNHRQSQFKEPLHSLSFDLFLAQLVIESGAVKAATSRDNAIGILQLKKEALNDCNIPKKFFRHRMAQVDCAVRLYVLNRRNLEPVFMERFGHLPKEKRERLFGLLLVQTYHSGIGNMRRLLTDPEQGRAAEYFANNHARFSAEDILGGMLFHNLGRPPWGWESLFYLVDIELVEQSLSH